jgi:hypothetical protein
MSLYDQKLQVNLDLNTSQKIMIENKSPKIGDFFEGIYPPGVSPYNNPRTSNNTPYKSYH